MIVTNLKRFQNFIICYGSLRKGDVIRHDNNDIMGVHYVFYGIRGDGYVYCPELNEKIHPEKLSRYIEDISRYEYKKLEYYGLSEDPSDYLMIIRKGDIIVESVSDMWMETNEKKVVDIDENETIICFEGEVEVKHENGTKILSNLNGITSSKRQKITLHSTDNAKIIKVKCRR